MGYTQHRSSRGPWALASGMLAIALIASACESIQPTLLPSTGFSPTGAPTTAVATVAPPTETPITPLPSSGVPMWPAAAPRADLQTIRCSGTIGPSDPLALVHLAASKIAGLVLRDYADIADPTTVCKGLDRRASILDARHLVIDGSCTEMDCAIAIVDIPEVSYHWFKLPFARSDSASFQAITPDLGAIAWIVEHQSGSGGRTVHVTDATGDVAVIFFPGFQGRCGIQLDSNRFGFSRSGRYLFELDQPIPATNTLAVIDVDTKAVVFSLVPPDVGWSAAKYPLMALWSPVSDTLFYRRGSDVVRWTPEAGREKVLSDVPWIDPSFTPDGQHVAWAVQTATSHDVYLAETADLSGARLIKKNRVKPVFLNNRQLWYRPEFSTGCTGEVTKPLVYNIRTGTEASSIVDEVATIWPGTASLH